MQQNFTVLIKNKNKNQQSEICTTSRGYAPWEVKSVSESAVSSHERDPWVTVTSVTKESNNGSDENMLPVLKQYHQQSLCSKINNTNI